MNRGGMMRAAMDRTRLESVADGYAFTYDGALVTLRGGRMYWPTRADAVAHARTLDVDVDDSGRLVPRVD